MTFNELMAQEAERALLGERSFDEGLAILMAKMKTMSMGIYPDFTPRIWRMMQKRSWLLLHPFARRKHKQYARKDNVSRREAFQRALIQLMQQKSQEGSVKTYHVFETSAGHAWDKKALPEHTIHVWWSSVFDESYPSNHHVFETRWDEL
jgi:hypothetical protein